jgi:type VI secretion system secreted protein Hcp
MLRVEAPASGYSSSQEMSIMAVDAFIWFDEPKSPKMAKVEGETKDDFFKKGGKGGATNGAFEIKDFTFGVENPTTIGSATGGAGAGKIKFNEFTIKKTTDKASAAFFKNCCAGAHYDTVTIAMRKAGGDPEAAGMAFLQFKFATVFTTKIDWSGPGDEGPEESITFVYGKLGIKYTTQEQTGTQIGDSITGWDQVLNKSDDDFFKGK